MSMQQIEDDWIKCLNEKSKRPMNLRELKWTWKTFLLERKRKQMIESFLRLSEENNFKISPEDCKIDPKTIETIKIRNE